MRNPHNWNPEFTIRTFLLGLRQKHLLLTVEFIQTVQGKLSNFVPDVAEHQTEGAKAP
jgi:hypothetical protein